MTIHRGKLQQMRNGEMARYANIVQTRNPFNLRNISQENALNLYIWKVQLVVHIFHKVKFGIQKAFCIVFEMSCTTKGMSSKQTAKRYGITQKTCWMFMQKIELLESRHKM